MGLFADTVDQPRRVALYIRVSTEEQQRDGYGLEAQERRLREYVEANKSMRLITKPEWVFKDVHTGSVLDRPGLTAVMKLVAEKKIDAVLVWKIDRFSRSLKHLISLFESMQTHEVSLISIQENIDFSGPIGNLIYQIFGAIAQFERELIKGRTRAGKMASADMGNFIGPVVPYGYKAVQSSGGKGRVLELVLEERKWVEKIYDWYIYDELGCGQIARKLSELGVPKGIASQKHHRKSDWTDENVQKILSYPIYRGEYIANKRDESGKLLPNEEWTITAYPACVSEVTWCRAQKIMETRTGGNKKPNVYMLSGKLVDTSLGQPRMFCGAKRSGGGYSYRRKQFTDSVGVHQPVFEIPGKQVDGYVWDQIQSILKDPQVFIEHYFSGDYDDPERIAKIEQELSQARQASVNVDLAEGRIHSAYEGGHMDEETFAARLAIQEEKNAQLEQTIADLTIQLNTLSNAKLEVEKLKEASQQVKYNLENLSSQGKRILCDLFIDRIELDRKELPSIEGGKKKQWNIRAEIYYKFNLDKLSELQSRGRTQKELTEAEGEFSDTLKKRNGRSGGT